MPVNLAAPDPAVIEPVTGIELGFAEAGIKKAGRRDLMLMRLAPESRVAGVFTQNSFAAAPVQVCRRHLDSGATIRALIVNAGNANCGTGDDGLAAALRSCEVVAQLVGCTISQVLPFSTGVILEPLPVAKIEAALPAAFAALAADRWADAAAAIMTTDTVAKAASRSFELDGVRVTVTGIAKGVGMLQPNMATMLAYIATDACVAHGTLQRMVREVADVSFNRVTVDGDTSTNDSFVLIATGASGVPEIIDAEPERCRALRDVIVEVAQQLAQAIARDGEGATKFITIAVNGAQDEAEALRVARSIGNSPLVKTALFASDPNLGRLLMAIGNARVEAMDTSLLDLFLAAGDDEVQVIQAGRRAATYREEDGARVMKPSEITIRVELGRGVASTVVWTCDFSYDYVKINAEYRREDGVRLRVGRTAVTLKALIDRADALLERVEALLPVASGSVDWSASTAFRWRKRGGRGALEPVRHIAKIALDNLRNIDRQREVIERNTRQFVAGRPANNVLLTGARGTGKSSLIKACFAAHADRGLRLIEVDKDDLVDLPDIVDLVAARPERFILFCDDLSFEEGESSYKALKVALDGSISAQSDNVLIYATSNRRHLMPEQMKDNLATRHASYVDAAGDANVEIHPADVIEEKISLSERFGLWVSFYPFRQDEYLAVVDEWMRHYGCGAADAEAVRRDALRWALERGSRSGRVAHQFARDWAGRDHH